jgi:hypothetical protein
MQDWFRKDNIGVVQKQSMQLNILHGQFQYLWDWVRLNTDPSLYNSHPIKVTVGCDARDSSRCLSISCCPSSRTEGHSQPVMLCYEDWPAVTTAVGRSTKESQIF